MWNSYPRLHYWSDSLNQVSQARKSHVIDALNQAYLGTVKENLCVKPAHPLALRNKSNHGQFVSNIVDTNIYPSCLHSLGNSRYPCGGYAHTSDRNCILHVNSGCVI